MEPQVLFLCRLPSGSENKNKIEIIPYSNWQGPIWINANYLDVVVLKNYGFDKVPIWLAATLAQVELSDIKKCGSMHECYDADAGAPLASTAEESPNHVFTGFVGWNMLVQDMLEGANDSLIVPMLMK